LADFDAVRFTDLTYREANTGYTRNYREVFSPDAPTGVKSRSFDIPTLAKEPNPSLTYDYTIVRLDGSVFQSDPITTDTMIALVSDGAGATHRIKVKLIDPDLNKAGLAAIKVDLVGMGEEGDRESTIFLPSQVSDRTVSLVQPNEGKPFSYNYTVTGYTVRGDVVMGRSGETSETTLFVKLPN
jgi:hypothetical protein